MLAKRMVAAVGGHNCVAEIVPQGVSVTATPAKGAKPGDIVGDYKILEPLGTGASSEVFKVEHAVTRRLEAMKILPDLAWLSLDEKNRYLREICVQASLNHQNIAGVYNGFWSNGDLALVMELVRGESLRSKIERERIPLQTTIGYMRDLLSALEYAHSMDVVHRDIKPANIMVTPDNSVKLIDFGLAENQADPDITKAGRFSGSLYYTSPEQVRGASNADLRSDIYSLGVVLYEMVTGRRPFEGNNTFELMFEHVNCDPVPPVDLEPSAGKELSNVIMTALAKEAGERFQSAREFREALELAVEPSAIESAPAKAAKVRIRIPETSLLSLRLGILDLALLLGLAAAIAGLSTANRDRQVFGTPGPVAVVRMPAVSKAESQKSGGWFVRTVQRLFPHDADY